MLISPTSIRILALIAFCACSLAFVQAQPASGDGVTENQQVSRQSSGERPSTFYYTDVHCSGLIEYQASYDMEVVGAEREAQRRVFGQGDYVYVSGGAQQGVRVGQEFAVVRPRGLFRGGYTKKKSFLGVYTQEVGKLRVIKVQNQTSLAEIEASCEVIQFGDFVRPVPLRALPQRRADSNLDRFAEPKGGQQGRIVLARGARELLATNDVVHIDLGFEDGVKVNDTLSVTRQTKGRTLTNFRDDDIVVAATGGFQSDVFKGGKFSNQAYRVRNPDRNQPGGPTTNFPDVRRRRPPIPDRVIGEIIITSVQERTSTGIIQRVIEEIHPGDDVERQP
ncbi:MAG: hypothetical protein WKF30_01000 [Pyrinomonadaceae bacterium]